MMSIEAMRILEHDVFTVHGSRTLQTLLAKRTEYMSQLPTHEVDSQRELRAVRRPSPLAR
jgi:hypothetical protein